MGFPRKCSREDCPKQNVISDYTVNCYSCNCQIHLMCYDIVTPIKAIFVNKNIVMVCVECLESNKEGTSPNPKRKQPNLFQRTIDTSNPALLSMSPPIISTPSNKNSTAKQSQQIQAVIETLVQKIETNTATIVGLKTSVDSMHGTVSQQKEVVDESIRAHNENISSIKTSLHQTHSFIQSVKKPTYAKVVSGAKTGHNRNADTPKSSRTQGNNGLSKTKTPSAVAAAGTVNKVIGKPLSPEKPRQKIVKKMPEKAIWIGRLHRDTTENDISSYIKNELNITNADQLEIRKLVKKDRDLSEYSFVSFRIACSDEMFNALLDVNKWPSYSQIREFKLEPIKSISGRINNETPSKNEVATPLVEQTTQAEQTPKIDHTSQDMETID